MHEQVHLACITAQDWNSDFLSLASFDIVLLLVIEIVLEAVAVSLQRCIAYLRT